MPEWLGAAIAFIYGTVVGSFLNVCIWRMPRDESIIRPGSHCPSCKTLLRAWDLVPLLSFLIQNRRCRYCGEPISWRYFLVELLTGGYFAVTYIWFGYSVNFFANALFGAALIAVFFIDLEHWIIPDQLSLFGIVVGLVHDGIELAIGGRQPYWIPVPGTDLLLPVPQSIAAIIICGGFFMAIAVISYYVFKKEGMGGGDIKLAAAIGANLGIWPSMVSFLIAVALGSLIGIGLILAGRKTRKDYVPFGPMMVAGAIIAIFFGQRILDSYLIFSGLGN
ncbi:MAG: prepilin peptidase [Armatimonadota bacterium]|nr:prepilin peptidase [Armatimonadota bacterium]